MTDRKLLERIKRGEGLPPILLKKEECNWSEDFGFIAGYTKKDMSKVDCVIVNGKEYLSADRVLEIIDEERKQYSPHQPSGAWACDYIRLGVMALKRGGAE